MWRTWWLVAGVVVVMVVAGGAGCASTKVETVWRGPGVGEGVEFERVMVMVVNATAGERRAGEDELVGAMRPGQGVRSYEVIGDEELKDRERVREVVKAQGVDGAVVLRLVASDKRSTYYPPEYRPSYGFYDYYGGFASYSVSPGYTVTDTIVRTEVSVYSVKDERLIWVGAGETENPSGVKDLVREVAKAAREELRREGVIR